MTWMVILILGVGLAAFGIKPVEIIQFAQVANGILLPVIAGILIWLANRSELLGSYRNSKVKNTLSIFILIVTIILGGRAILNVFGLI